VKDRRGPATVTG